MSMFGLGGNSRLERPPQIDIEVPDQGGSIMLTSFFKRSAFLSEGIMLLDEHDQGSQSSTYVSLGCGEGAEQVCLAALHSRLRPDTELELRGYDRDVTATLQGCKDMFLIPFSRYLRSPEEMEWDQEVSWSEDGYSEPASTEPLSEIMTTLQEYGFEVNDEVPTKLHSNGLYGGYGYAVSAKRVLAPYNPFLSHHDITQPLPVREKGIADLVQASGLFYHMDSVEQANRALRNAAEFLREGEPGVLNLGAVDNESILAWPLRWRKDQVITYGKWLSEYAEPILSTDYRLDRVTVDQGDTIIAPHIFARA